MKPLLFTLKCWPVITLVVIGLCYLTQALASLFGINLPEQTNIDIVRQVFSHAFDDARHFAACAQVTAIVVIFCPVAEELIFRLPIRWLKHWGFAVVLSGLFAAAHYIQAPWPDNAFFALFCFGLAQCWLYRRTQRIWCSMLNHALFNAANLILALLIPTA